MILATLCAILPMPICPNTLPFISSPLKFAGAFFSKLLSRLFTLASYSIRESIKNSATTSSATLSALLVGALITAIRRCVAHSTSTLSTPTLWRAMTFRLGHRSMSSRVIGRARQMIAASFPDARNRSPPLCALPDSLRRAHRYFYQEILSCLFLPFRPLQRIGDLAHQLLIVVLLIDGGYLHSLQ